MNIARVKRVIVSDYFLETIFSKGTEAARVTHDALPLGAVLVAVNRFSAYAIELQYVHPSFDEVPEGNEIPMLNPMFERAPLP